MIYRTNKKENPFAQIDKYPINDSRLSWKAKGILAYLLSKPNDWELVVSDLINHSSDGKGSTRNGINELLEYGYLVRTDKGHREDGRFLGNSYDLYENPTLNESGPDTENPDVAQNETEPDPKNPEAAQNELNAASQKPGTGLDQNEAGSQKPGSGLESNEAGTGLSASGSTASGKLHTTNNDNSNNEVTNKNSLVTDSGESVTCLPDKKAYDWNLMALVPEDYPKGTADGRILRFTIWFHQRVRENFSDYKHVKNANLFKWREHIRLMYEQDGISLQKMLDVAKWIFYEDEDRFWYTVIRSTDNFRHKWDNINAAILRSTETERREKSKRRSFTRHEGQMLMLDNGLLKNERTGGGYDFDELFEHLEGDGKSAKYVIKKSCLNMFKTWGR